MSECDFCSYHSITYRSGGKAPVNLPHAPSCRDLASCLNRRVFPEYSFLIDSGRELQSQNCQHCILQVFLGGFPVSTKQISQCVRTDWTPAKCGKLHQNPWIKRSWFLGMHWWTKADEVAKSNITHPLGFGQKTPPLLERHQQLCAMGMFWCQ